MKKSESLAEQHFPTTRIEALTDGVFAIAMTLLVLDLNIAELGEAASNMELWNAFLAIQDNIISFVISFLLLGSMWAVHVRQFAHIKEADRHVTLINTLRLLVVVLIPFTTSIAGAYSGVLLAQILFPLNFLLLALVSWWQWEYSAKHLKNDMSARQKHYATVRNKVVVSVALMVTVGAAIFGAYAFFLFTSAPLIMKFFIKSTKNRS